MSGGAPPCLVLPRAPGGFRPAPPLAALPWDEVPALPPLARTEDGGPPIQATTVRACGDGEAFYARWECADREAWGTLRERDAPIYEEEVVELFLAPGAEDPGRYVEFEVAPTGVFFDALIGNPNRRRAGLEIGTEWDCPGVVWEAGALPGRAAGAQGWWAALAVPWRGVLEALGRPPGELPSVWRANFYRIDRPRDGAPEYTAWSPTLVAPPDFHRPARFGTLLIRE